MYLRQVLASWTTGDSDMLSMKFSNSWFWLMKDGWHTCNFAIQRMLFGLYSLLYMYVTFVFTRLDLLVELYLSNLSDHQDCSLLTEIFPINPISICTKNSFPRSNFKHRKELSNDRTSIYAENFSQQTIWYLCKEFFSSIQFLCLLIYFILIDLIICIIRR